MGDGEVCAVTGVSFPLQRQLWHGGPLRCLGVGPRVKKVGFLTVKVYAVAMYVDADAAAASAQGRAAHDLLKDGAFDKALQMHMVRAVSGEQFSKALDEGLRPLLKGEEEVLAPLADFFKAQQLEVGSEVTLLWRADGPTEVCLRAGGDAAPYAEASAGLTVASPRLGQALWQLYLAPDTPTPEARDAWLAAAAALA